MKRYAFSMALASTLAMASVPALAGEEKSVSQFCKSVNDWGLTHAECVTIFSEGKAVPHIVEQCSKPAVQRATGSRDLKGCIEAILNLVK